MREPVFDLDPLCEADNSSDVPPRTPRTKGEQMNVITGPGEYVCRDGKRAVVLASWHGWFVGIYDDDADEPTTWNDHGRIVPHVESDNDITGPCVPPAPPTLVERLREHGSQQRQGFQVFNPSICIEAADEIERLTKEHDEALGELDTVRRREAEKSKVIDKLDQERDELQDAHRRLQEAAKDVLVSEYASAIGYYLLWKTRFDALAQATKGTP